MFEKKTCFYLFAYDQVIKFLMHILYKKIKIVFLSYFEKHKNQLMGIITSLWLSIKIWPKFQKHHKNKKKLLIFGMWILQCNAYSRY